jgi:hypothetical protein
MQLFRPRPEYDGQSERAAWRRPGTVQTPASGDLFPGDDYGTFLGALPGFPMCYFIGGGGAGEIEYPLPDATGI